MRSLLLSLLLVVGGSIAATAQTYTTHLTQGAATGGSVRVFQSSAVAAVVNGKINIGVEQKTTPTPSRTPSPATVVSPSDDEGSTEETAVDTNKKVVKNAQKVNGYRVQVYAGSNSREDKSKAESIGNQIKHLFPDQPVYVHFYSPRWICRMGNYRTYEEGAEMLQRVKEAGYRTASLVKGTITLTD